MKILLVTMTVVLVASIAGFCLAIAGPQIIGYKWFGVVLIGSTMSCIITPIVLSNIAESMEGREK